MNNFAITSAGIGEALTRSASALFEAGNTIDESIALVTAANSVIQNPEQVGTALKTLSLRIRGVKTELVEAGLETEGMAETTAQLQAKLLALTNGKVNIMLSADEFKSTTQVLREMAGVWTEMTDVQQAAALELLGGKRQANILSSLLTNFQTVEDVIATSMNSAGSAMEENEKYLDSIQGRIDIFNNSLQTFWNNVISSDVAKWTVDRGTDIISILDTTTGKVFALVSAIHLITKFKGINISNVFQGLQQSIEQINKAKTTLNALTFKDTANGAFNPSDITAYAAAVSSLTPKMQAQALAASGLNEIQIKNALSTNQVSEENIKLAMAQVHATKSTQQFATVTGEMAQAILASQGITLSSTAADFLKEHSTEQVTKAMIENAMTTGALTAQEGAQIMTALGLTGANHGLAASFKAVGTAISFAFKANPLGFILNLASTILAAIPIVKGLADTFTDSAEEIKEQAQEISNTYSKAVDEINSNLEKLKIDDDGSIAALTKEFETLTAGVDRYGNNLSLTSDQYGRYKEICEQIVDINPRIASGYDSATEAIGNNTDALAQLIEFQKERARLAAEEYVNDENLETLAKDEVNDYKDAQKQRGKVVGKRNELFGMLSQGSTKDTMEYILRTLGYGEAEIASTIERYYLYAMKDYDSSRFMVDFIDEIDKKYKNFDGHVDELDKFFDEYENTIRNGEKSVEEAQNGLIDKLLIVPKSSKDYDKLTSEGKNFLTDWINNNEIFKMDASTTAEDVQDMRDIILDMMDVLVDDAKTIDYNGKMVSAQDILEQIYNLDPSSVNYEDYKAQINTMLEAFWNSLSQDQKDQYGLTDFESFKITFGFDFETEKNQIETAKNQVAGFLDVSTDEIQKNLDGMSATEIKAFYSIDWNEVGKDGVGSWQDVVKQIHASIQGDNVVPVKTYSVLTESVGSYNDILAQTSEIVADNTEVTQEYKDSLAELGISETELNECFDENNGLVVKNAKQLNKLVKSSKKNVAENIKLAKSQARLEYYDLYKQMRDFTRGLDYTSEGYAILTDEQRAQIDSLYAEMDAINSAIARFSTLEAQLLGVTNAYTKFADAQTADEENEYSSQAESMVEAFATALNTGDLGTETAREAMLGLVPEEVYKDLDTVEEKLDAIAKYFNEGELSKYFSIEFDDDGAVESVDITRDDLKQFFEAGREKGVFTGNWEHFDLSEDVTSLEQFSKAMNITEEVAFALFEALENHDAGNLFDPSNILDKFMSGNIEYQAYNNAKAITELQYQLANGAISAEEYAKKMVGLDGQLAAGALTQEKYNAEVANLKKQLEDGTITQQEYNEAVLGLANQQDKIAEDAYNQATAYYDKSKALEDCNKKLKEYSDLLSDEDGLDKDGNPIDKEQVEKDIEDVSNEIQKLMEELEVLGEPTEMTISLASDYVQEQIDDVEDSIKELANNESDILVKIDTKFEEVQNSDFDLSQFGLSKDGNGNWTGVAEFVTSMGLNPADQATIDAVTNYINLVDEQHTLNLLMGPETTTVLDTLADINYTLKDIATKLGVDYTLDVNTSLDTSPVQKFLNTPLAKTISVSLKKIGEWFGFADGTAHVGGTAFASGTAYKGGSWGAPKTETALVGEIGPELLVRGDRWTTVGENGAEFTQVKKGDIIFNHKQTKQLLENGYVTGRGKLKGGSAFASGTAYAGIYTYDKYRNKEKTAYQGSNVSNSASKLSKAAKDISKASDKLSDDFKEIFDWIEVRVEEITGALDVRSAKLENAVGFNKQNAVIDDMIELNQKLYDNLTAGASKYYAQDGSIAIESFVGKVGESTLEAIQDYREWIQKGDDATQQAEEVLTEISSLAKQAIDNISQDFENKTSLNDNKIDQLEAYNALLETDKGFESEKVYKEMIKANNANIEQLKKQRKEMQDELNAQVKAGNIKKYSQDWYDAVNEIAAVDTEIIELTTDTENYQDAINELHWDKFDALVGRLEAVSEEAENLIDILGNKDLVDDGGNWTDEGITTLGLYAQQMEAAEVQAKKYQEEIKYLNDNWQALGYTEEEYIEKLNELKDGQYDAIKSYHDAKDAIVDLNKERIDAIKEGIEKEIEAYEKLIEAKKKELDAEKDLYDFQKSVMEQEKDIADIQRQLAALSGDNSASARAKRAQLEAELAEAKAALEESYYERSVQNQQEALDKELENFQEAKDKEMEGWDEYLENTEQVVSDSLATIQDNTDTVYQTLAAMGKEYSLSITEAITSPWKDGEMAIQSFSEQFGIAMSTTVEELEALAAQFNAIMSDIEQAGGNAVNTATSNTTNYTSAEYKEPTSSNTSSGGGASSSNTSSTAGLVSGISGTIYYGQTGDRVKKLQQVLNELGYNCGNVDGKFGPKTLAAVKKFQKAMGISVDGKVGPETKKKFKLKGYAVGSTGIDKDQLAILDELGDELQFVPGNNGRLAYVKKGTGIVPADLTERLMNLAMDPQSMLDANRPQIGVHPEIHNTEINLSITYGDMVSIGEYNGANIGDLEKMVAKQFDKHTKDLNNALRKFTR